jgi:hypothetical protein
VLLYDFPLYLSSLIARDGWTRIANRTERLEQSPDGRGFICPGKWMSWLHASNVFPMLGRFILHRALAQWPIRFSDQTPSSGRPEISFIIPFRGTARLPQLLMTVRSILAQRGAAVECLVVEQSAVNEIAGLPAGVRHIYLSHPDDPVAWRKSWAFNVGVRQAAAPVVVCHDADIPVPCDYAGEILALINRGYESVSIQRFLLRLDEKDTAAVIRNGIVPSATPEDIWQNWVGGTIALTREAFFRIGGFDERFIGWGGEDMEFFERCATLKQYRFGYLPFLHLWHPHQEGKFYAGKEQTLAFMNDVLAISPEQRIEELKAKAMLNDE